MGGCENVHTILQRKLDQANQANNGLLKRIISLEKCIEERDLKVVELKEALEEKNQAIVELKEALEERVRDGRPSV